MNINAKLLNISEYIPAMLFNRITCDDKAELSSSKLRFNINETHNIIHYINRQKEKTQTFITVNAEKAFDKIQQQFLITQ